MKIRKLRKKSFITLAPDDGVMAVWAKCHLVKWFTTKRNLPIFLKSSQNKTVVEPKKAKKLHQSPI
jgi:hypothetical protein